MYLILLCYFFLLDWVKVAQSCPTLCDPLDCIVHGILQARILEWLAVLFSRASSQPRDQTQVSHIAGGFFTSWASREVQEYWSGSLSLLQWIFLTQFLMNYKFYILFLLFYWASQVALEIKNLLANAADTRDTDSIPGSRRSPGRGHGNPLQYSCFENFKNRRAWEATVHRVTKNYSISYP